MDKRFHCLNRAGLYNMIPPGSVAVFFSGSDICRTNDESYPFFADRNFYYLTGIGQKNSVLVAERETDYSVSETLYILPPDPMAERWTGRRLTPIQAEAVSGISDIRPVSSFESDLHRLFVSGEIESLYLDLYKAGKNDIDRPSHVLAHRLAADYPYIVIHDSHSLCGELRLIKKPCEIEALRQSEKITGEGILAMMRSSRPGMYEYQYKAEYDRALGHHGPYMYGFPPIISTGSNNFCIHYYEYTGIARDGDMVLNDVGAQYDGLITDVSRGWPANGRFTDRQKLLYMCALQTSDHMFSVIKPGMAMSDVDKTIRTYNAELLRDAGVLSDTADIGRLMWHGGSHHIGYDVHDAVKTPETIAPGMIFCIDVGIYNEEWGIGFRLEDNCLVTESGCENLSAGIPRTIEDIESVMR